MGRKAKKELDEKLLLTETELIEILGDKAKRLSKREIDGLALSLYQFTLLIHQSDI